jgi:hypothetical protein
MLPFPDFSCFVAWIILEEELIELRNTFLPHAESLSENTLA